MNGSSQSAWPVYRLGQIAKIAREALQPAEITDGTQYVGLEDISGETGEASPRRVSAGELQSAKFAYSSAHLLYGKLRPNLRKVARPLEVGICSTDILPLLPGAIADRDYLFHWLRSPVVVETVTSRTSGANLPRISPQRLLELEVPLPPLAEQRRIAALLDRADAVRRKREESRRLVDELQRSVFLEMFGDPVRNEMGWETLSVLDASHRVQIGPFGSLLHEADYVTDGVPLVNPMHIRGGVIVADPRYSVTLEKMLELASYRLEVNDVVLGRRGEMGRCAVVSEAQDGYLCGTGSLLVRPKLDQVTPQYLASFLSAASVRRLLEQATQGATMPNLNRGIIAKLRIPLPPMHVQKRFSDLSHLRLPALVGRLSFASATAERLGAAIQGTWVTPDGAK